MELRAFHSAYIFAVVFALGSAHGVTLGCVCMVVIQIAIRFLTHIAGLIEGLTAISALFVSIFTLWNLAEQRLAKLRRKRKKGGAGSRSR